MNGNGMFVLNGEATKGLEILRRYGLTRYESQAYFSLLVLGETDAGRLSRQSGVPQSKVYWTLDNLREKNLVEVTQQFPKKVVALPFEKYIAECVKAKRREIDEFREGRKRLRELLYKLQTLSPKHAENLKIFEPSYKRGLNSSSFNDK